MPQQSFPFLISNSVINTCGVRMLWKCTSYLHLFDLVAPSYPGSASMQWIKPGCTDQTSSSWAFSVILAFYFYFCAIPRFLSGCSLLQTLDSYCSCSHGSSCYIVNFLATFMEGVYWGWSFKKCSHTTKLKLKCVRIEGTHVDTSAMCLCRRVSQRSSSSSKTTSFILVSPIPLVSNLTERVSLPMVKANWKIWQWEWHLFPIQIDTEAL